MTFNELYPIFKADKAIEVKPSTKALHGMHWKMLGPEIGDKSVSDFGRIDARMLLSRMIDGGLAQKTAKDRMAFVRQLLRFAAGVLEVSIKPLDWGLKFPEAKPRGIKNFTEAEMLSIVKHAIEGLEAGHSSILAVLLSILTGMRIGETLALKWKDIDWTHGIISVRRNVVKIYNPDVNADTYVVGTPKTRAGYRDLPMLTTLRRALRSAGGRKPNPDFYVVGNSERPKGHGAVRDTYSRFLKKYHLPDVNFHGLRHTYATLLVESGGDIKAISELLGHSSVSITLNLYVHPSAKTKRDAVNKAFRKLRVKDLRN